jgi:hypothetical protein
MMRVCLSVPNSLTYPQGGHLWVFINWALGFRSIGCDVIWLDVVPVSMPVTELQQRLAYLRTLLSPFGINAIAVDFISDADFTSVLHDAQLPTVDDFGGFDLLFDLRYDLPPRLVKCAKRSALLDIDPGSLQLALDGGGYAPPRHDVFFTIGETVGRSKYFTGAARTWVYTPPCVFLAEWPVCPAPNGAPWTTVAHWWSAPWMPDETGGFFCDSKREGFQAFMGLPAKVSARFILALNLGDDQTEKARIEQHGFEVLEAHEIVSTPTKYRDFIRRSAGEFSAAKPSYVRYKTAWISDRTLCYLASGKPCVVEDTGPSTILPSGKGLHRVRDAEAAATSLRRIYERYDDEAREARAIAEAIFDARQICRRIISIAA